MKKSALIIGLTACLLWPSSAEALKIKLKKEATPPVDYTAWADTTELPQEANGVRLYYPMTRPEDGAAVIRGSIDVPGLKAGQVFLAAMVYATDNFDRERQEGFESVDYDGRSFVALLKSTQGSNATETTYTRSVKVTARDGAFDFETRDIDVRHREKGLIPRTQALEKLHPESNKRHAELVKELAEVNSAYLHSLAEYAATRKDIKAPNLEKVKKGLVTTGMNGDEVKIVLGPPLDTRRSGERTRWIYDNEYVLIFTGGVVTKIVE